MLPTARDYDELIRKFRWDIPAQYNIAVDCCDRWAAQDAGRLAIQHIHGDGRVDDITYGWLRDTSNRLANVLRAQGVKRGDRVAIMLPQSPEVAAAHFAIYKLAAVALPVAVLFGPDALLYRLQNSAARALLTNAAGLAKLEQVRDPRKALEPESAGAALARGAHHVLCLLQPYLDPNSREHLQKLADSYQRT